MLIGRTRLFKSRGPLAHLRSRPSTLTVGRQIFLAMIAIPYWDFWALLRYSPRAARAPIDRLVFTVTAYTAGLVFDNIVVNDPVVAAVPEPASWAMMMAGIGVLGGAARRRRRVSTRVQFAA